MILQPILPDRLWLIPEGRGCANHYVLRIDGGAVLFEVAREPEELLPLLQSRSLSPSFLVATHGHYDHIGCADAWREQTSAPLGIGLHEAPWLERPELNLASPALPGQSMHRPAERLLISGERVKLDSHWSFEVWETPGHTSGGCCYLLLESIEDAQQPRALLTGDTIIGFTVGRTDLPGGSDPELEKTLAALTKRLRTLPEALPILSGHGAVYPLRAVLEHNPWLPLETEISI